MHYNHDIYVVIEFLHVKPGKGPAFVRTKLKSMTNGKVVDNTFPSGHKIETVRIERRKYQFLYKDELGFHFMNNETYDQTMIDSKLIDNPGLIKEGSEVEILFNADDENPLTIELPQYLEFEITYTEPGQKGNTATNAQKPAKIETGIEIMVPLFINEGDRIKVDTRTSKYHERVK